MTTDPLKALANDDPSDNLGSDPAEPKRIERAERQQRALLEGIYRAAPVGIGMVVDRVIQEANDTLCQMTGYTRDELLGQSARLLYPTDADYEYVGQKKYQQIAKHGSGSVETRWRRKDGAVMDILLSSTALDPLRFSAGVVFTALDITERKRAEEALRERENTLQRVFDVLPIGLWFADKEGRLLRGNPAGVAIWGAEPKVAPSDYGVFKARRLPSGREIAPEDWALAHTVREGVTVVDELLEIDAFDGQKKIILNYSAPILDDSGAVQGAIVVNQDITKRKQVEAALRESEANLQKAQRVANVGSWVWYIQSNRVEYSEQMCRIFGIDQETFSGDMADVIASAIHPDDRAAVERANVAVMEEGKPLPLEYRVVWPDGTERVVWAEAGELVRDENGLPFSLSGVVHDITERKRAEVERARLLAQQIAINELALALGESLNLAEVYQTIHQHIRRLIDVNCFIISSYDAQAQLIRAEYAADERAYDVSAFPPIPLGPPGAGTQSRVIHSGQPLYTPDHQAAVRHSSVRYKIENDGSVHPEEPSAPERPDSIRSAAYLPMKIKGQTVGILQAQSRRLDAYTPDDIGLLAGIANVAAVAIQNARLHQDVLRELGERRRAEAELHQVNHFLDTIIENIPNMIFVKDAQALRFVRFNQAGALLLGYSRQELLGKNDYDLFPQQQADFFTSKDREVLASRCLNDIPEECVNTKTGPRILHTKKLPILDINGEPLYLLGISEDITERKAAEEALLARAHQQAVIARLSQFALQATDLQPLLDYAVAQVTDTLGVEYCKVLELLPDGRALKLVAGVGWRPGLVGAATVSAGRDSQAGFTLLADQPVISEDLRLETRFHGPALLLDHGIISGMSVVIHTADTQFGVLGAHTARRRVFTSDDVHFLQGVASLLAEAIQRLHAEAALFAERTLLRTLVDNLPDAVYVKDTVGRKTLTNPVDLRFIGAATEADVLGKTDFEVFPHDLAAVFADDDRRILQSGEPILNQEERVILPEGSLGWLLTSKVPLRDSAGEIIGLVGIGHDITKRKQDEEEIRKLNAELEARVEQRTRQLREAQDQLVRQERLAVVGQLAGGMGHELRNPLGVISNAVYYLKMIQPDAPQAVIEYLSIVEKEIFTAEKIISDLLDFAHPRPPEPKAVVLPHVVRDVLARFPTPVNIHAVLDLPADLPPVRVDPAQITQVLNSLILNACQAMPRGGELAIAGRRIGSGGTGFVAISVRDTGPGIPPEHMEQLYEPLFTTKTKGFGLGLALSKKLIEANGGRIKAQSEVGAGATFTLWLPVDRDAGLS